MRHNELTEYDADYDHPARPDDDPRPGDRCKDCGAQITWIGPDPASDWGHAEPMYDEATARRLAELMAAPLPHLPTQSRDGRPHLTYYIWPDTLSFVWSGEPDEPVEVCHGGYGEPPAWRFTPEYIEDVSGLRWSQMNDASVLLAAFKQACDAWARDHGSEYKVPGTRPPRRCDHTVVVQGAPQTCGRPIIDEREGLCDRPGEHVD